MLNQHGRKDDEHPSNGSFSQANSKNRLPGGYMGKMLRVDLSRNEINESELPSENILRQYLGGQGLGQWILMQELPSDIEPYSPGNILCFTTGPLTGTSRTPAGVAYTVTTLSNITGFGSSHIGTIVNSSGMGHWGPFLKFSGYDALIITGAATTPVYLWINEGKAKICDASHLWGKDSHETENLVRKEIGEPKACVATLGPAGENLVKSAMILNDSNHSAAHGAGAVMGSKKLKAIAVYGKLKVPVVDDKMLAKAGSNWRSKIVPYKYPKKGTKESGNYHQTRNGPGYGSRIGALVRNNWQSSVFPEANKDFNTQEFTAKPCFKCSRSCPYDAKITQGKHAGTIATLNAGSEHMEGAAFTFGVGGSDVRYLVEVLDRLGIEACNFGCAAALVFEAYDRGLITSKDTDGLELKWGDAEAVEKLMWKMATRDGWLGNALADGARATAERIGGGALNFAVYVKQGTPAMHDWRPYMGLMLGQIVSSGGIKPQFHSFELREIDLQGGAPDLGYSDATPPGIDEGKAREVFLSGLYRFLMGAAGICWFGIPIHAEGILQDALDALAATTGWSDFDLKEAMAVGERIWQMEHIFHLRYGWTPDEDLNNVGPRFLEPVPDGPYKGSSIAQFLPELLRSFYRECGWDEETGKPTLSTIKRLGLEEYFPAENVQLG
ncbi:aldehyde ferredoxin oxidoreductase family protein [Thermodesulfobacteriota bacterium]